MVGSAGGGSLATILSSSLLVVFAASPDLAEAVCGREPKHASPFIALLQRLMGTSADFVCCARASGLSCWHPRRPAETVNSVGIGIGREPATSHYLDASGHTKTRQYRRAGRADYESYTRK
jgi:hypothetical protein